MFTGIIEATAKVMKTMKTGFVLERPKMFDDIKIGASIAVSGACLSVVAFDKKSMTFDVVPMTFSKTKLGSLTVGDSVNLERAMKADGRFDGHIVTGHVEGVGKVVDFKRALSPGTHLCKFFPASQAPSPGPSPRLLAEQRGEGGATVSQFNMLVGRVWKGTSESKKSPHVLVERARAMRKVPTIGEKKLWEKLRKNSINGIRFRRQHPLGLYIVDFYADALKLAIEVDGGIHDDPALKEYELQRTENLNARGISVMRFSNNDIVHRLDDVLSAIVAFSKSPLPRLIEGERSETEIPGEGIGEGADTRSAWKAPHGFGLSVVQAGVGACERSETEIPGEGLGVHDATGTLLSIDIPSSLTRFIVPHGSITLDGVSLTVASFKKNKVTVALIPHTLRMTTLQYLRPGDAINIETDIIARYSLSRRS